MIGSFWSKCDYTALESNLNLHRNEPYQGFLQFSNPVVCKNSIHKYFTLWEVAYSNRG
jgi:hypothetical protein